MSELTLNGLRAANKARQADQRRAESNKRSLLILVYQYLLEQGYGKSAETIQSESRADLSKYCVCDNVDLTTVFQDYIAFYHVRFQKEPRFIKKVESTDLKNRSRAKSMDTRPRRDSTTSQPAQARAKAQRKESDDSNSSASQSPSQSAQKKAPRESRLSNNELRQKHPTAGPQKRDSADLTDKKMPKQILDLRTMIQDYTTIHLDAGGEVRVGGRQVTPPKEEKSNPEDEKVPKPLGGLIPPDCSKEWRELGYVIAKDIFSQDPNVHWNDIIGLDGAKQVIKESVVYPIKYPQLFQGILTPWRGVLLFGPPGTGKTLLAKAVATECRTTFFNVSASTVVSKWRGDSEKLVRVLFEMARLHAPSTIFLDEVDSLMGQRDSQEHEGSRRMKTELLTQMDGLLKTQDLVFLLAASNLPWELDYALLRRLEKRILVDLPSHEAREAMFEAMLPPVICTPRSNGLRLHSQLEYDLLAQRSEGYSGSDIKLVCKEAAMNSLRQVFHILESTEEVEEDSDHPLQLEEVNTERVLAALAKVRPSAHNVTKRYLQWQQEFQAL